MRSVYVLFLLSYNFWKFGQFSEFAFEVPDGYAHPNGKKKNHKML